MIEHNMVVTVHQYAKQYGYSYDHVVACSCDALLTGAGSDFDRTVRLHKEQAVYDALGLKFSVTKTPEKRS